jgi:hypothetical protein
MSYRYTNTDKWNDGWFSNLKPLEKLLFNYLCDECDIAGFIEVITKNWAIEIGTTESAIKEALKGLQRAFIYSLEGDTIFIRNFLKHQKNLPLKENNPAHKGILKRFELYRYKFDIQDVDLFIERGLEGASKGLERGVGNGNGNGNIKAISWKTDYNLYLEECKRGFKEAYEDKEFMSKLQEFHINLDIRKSMEKAFLSFWGTKTGWKNKKSSRSNEVDWRATIMNTISKNPVYKTNGRQQPTINDDERFIKGRRQEPSVI